VGSGPPEGAATGAPAAAGRGRVARRVLFVAALAATLGIAAAYGVDAVLALLQRGIGAIVLVSLLFMLVQVLPAMAWLQIAPMAQASGRLRAAYMANWLAGSVNTLLPLASVSGEAARARWLSLAGTPLADTTLRIVVIKTLEALAIASLGAGALWLLWRARGAAPVTQALALGWSALAAGSLAFVWLQAHGRAVAALQRRLGRHWRRGAAALGRLAPLEEGLRRAYARPRQLAGALVLMIAFRLALVVEVYLLAGALGHPVSLEWALIIEGAGASLRGAAFVVPAGVGVQELAYVGLAHAGGLEPAALLALSLARRGREVLTAVPALAGWQLREAALLWR